MGDPLQERPDHFLAFERAPVLRNHPFDIQGFSHIIPIIHAHHEKWDGSGYPEGLKGDEIPLSARIVAIADVFDALTSKRVYKDAHGFNDAVETIKKGAGKHFDPNLVEVFLNELGAIRRIYEQIGRAHV